MRKNKLNLWILPTKLAIIVAIIFFSLFFIIGYLGRILKTLDFFKIKDIITKSDVDLSYLKGQNIFELNLKKEANYILESHPNFRSVRLIRILPDRLFVEFIRRQPLALVKLYRNFCVDIDLVLFDLPELLQELDLPVICGLETKIFGPKSNRKYNIKELILALDIIKEAKRNRILKDCKIKKIDVATFSNTTFFILEGLEIKIGQEDIRNRLFMLGNLLIQLKNDLNNIKYIDLRFKEPVIKYKN